MGNCCRRKPVPVPATKAVVPRDKPDVYDEILKHLLTEVEEDWSLGIIQAPSKEAKLGDHNLHQFIPQRGIRKWHKRIQVQDWDTGTRRGRRWGWGEIFCYPNKTSIAAGLQRLLKELPKRNSKDISKYAITCLHLAGDYMSPGGLRSVIVLIAY